MNPQVTLVVTAILGNAILLLSYLVTSPSTADFGRVPKSLHLYLLVAALIAYLCHLAFVALLAREQRASDNALYLSAACVAFYCSLQLAFVPLVRRVVAGKSSVWSLRALLMLCIIPMVLLAGIGIEVGGLTLATLGLIPAAHVVLNDAIVYGFLL